MTRSVRIRVPEASLWWDLVRSLPEGDCTARRLRDGTIELTNHGAADEHEARLELTFFVRAWHLRHPDVPIELVS